MEKDILLSKLIGLARATDGSEHLITPGATALIRECLAAMGDNVSVEGLADKVTQAKRSMVPDCFLCANPCGRTEDYDAHFLQTAPEPLRSLKQALLSRLLAGTVADSSLYRSLIALGMEDEDIVRAVLTETDSTEV